MDTLRDGRSPATKWFACNGRQLAKLARAGLAWLEQNQQQVNALNVFPVPDGDTGTNMVLTMRSACKQIEGSEDNSVAKVAKELSQGALMGARGNSGVILSQIWRGLARALEGKESFDAHDLGQALTEAANTAYKGVMTPVEGTLLTVIREASQEAVDAATKSSDLRFVLERTLERSQQSLERTPELLPVLKEAGVVDAGGQGLVFILEGMLRYVYGQSAAQPAAQPAAQAAGPVAEWSAPVPASGQPQPAQARVAPAGGLEYPYDVQFILQGSNLDVLEVRRTIDAMGDSTVVVGDEDTIKVHVHVKDPGQPISYGVSLGRLSDVVVENMQMQMEEIIGSSQAISAALARTVRIEPGQVAVLAVAPGDGLAQVFRSLGAAGIIDGGQTNNPSTEEIFQAVQDVPTDKVIILPNNKNIIMAAEAARGLSPKQVAVVPTCTIPQGVSALFAYSPTGEMEQMVSQMQAATGSVATGEITRATRSVTLDGVSVEEGDIIGLANNRLCAAGPSWETILPAMLEEMNVAERELVSVYYGKEVSASEAAAVGHQIEALYPGIEVELVAGGQAHYYFILGAE